MMKRKEINIYLYISAVAITTIVFLVGFIIGAGINQIKLQQVYDLEHQIRVDALSNELAYEIITEHVCESLNISVYTEQVTDIGKRLTYMENVYGYDSPQVVNLKSYYSLLLIRHMMINDKLLEECSAGGKPRVLYFYTNYQGCADCEDQGLVLTSVHRDNPKFLIYSFEYRENNTALEILKEKYGVEQHKLPTIVINDTPYHGFQSKEQLNELLGFS
jgi:hypothetical protein